MYDFFLFDLDGTLTDPQVGMRKSLEYALAAMGEKTDFTNFNAFIGPPLRDTLRDFFGFTGEKTEIAVEKYREYYGETGIFENEVYPGIVEMLTALKDKGVKMAVATSKVTEYAERVLVHFDLAKYFDYVCGAKFDGSRSAKSEIIADVLERYKKTACKKAVMVGDRKYDILGAKSAGIDSIGVLWGHGSAVELSDAGATHTVARPRDLLKFIFLNEDLS
ncbi:MAG: HAD-IA family hydrolase [Defluviitaleaceae bacterium]|nr:HAD-IA family hydrolase [Defluviitaleaceae bacterium]